MEWKSVEEYNGNYWISENGNVLSKSRIVITGNGKKRSINERILKPKINKDGYLFVTLSLEGKSQTNYVHRLVANAFIPNSDNLPQVNHISGDKLDNSISNLEWVDARTNTLHAYQNGLNSHCKGDHSFAVGVIDKCADRTFGTIKEFCDYYNINYNTGRNALNGFAKLPKHIPVSIDCLTKVKSA